MSDEPSKAMSSEHWDGAFRSRPARFGIEPSESALVAAKAFSRLAHPSVLDLGSGAGRDAIYFATSGMRVVALDFSRVALAELEAVGESVGPTYPIQTVHHDVLEPLPFADATFDGCYAHMLLCMHFTLVQLETLALQVRRVLRPGGTFVYTARTTSDPDFGVGAHHGENIYEDEGFAVHFFDRAMVDRLANGFRVLDVTEFEEGALPRRLFTVVLERL